MPRQTNEPGKDSPSVFSVSKNLALALLGGILMLGIAIGVGFSSVANASSTSINTVTQISEVAPNSNLCAQYGAGAIVTDARVFVTLNPFNVYVSQPQTRPGCVLQPSNWAVLEQRKLVTSEQIRACKSQMNTFGFTGQLESQPNINCLYQNNEMGNLFLSQNGMPANN